MYRCLCYGDIAGSADELCLCHFWFDACGSGFGLAIGDVVSGEGGFWGCR